MAPTDPTSVDRASGSPDAPAGELVEALQERSDEQALELAAALSALARTLLDSEPLETTLERVADLSVSAVPGCTAAGVTLLRDGRFVTAAATDELTREVDAEQYAADDGPCLDAARTLRINRVDLREADQRWPGFAAHAREAGILSYLAAPLVVREEGAGSLNLYSSSPDGFDALDDAMVALFSAQASVALASSQLHERSVTLSEQLQRVMASRAVIEQAKGVVMAQQHVDADTAFAVLRERSQRTNRKLRDVAQQLVDDLLT